MTPTLISKLIQRAHGDRYRPRHDGTQELADGTRWLDILRDLRAFIATLEPITEPFRRPSRSAAVRIPVALLT